MKHYDVIIIGAGAAGMFCGIHSAAFGKRVLVTDHAKKPGEKIRISGGGRCNFTNLYCGPDNFISQNPHFAKSALARYTQHDFIELINRHSVAWHEKKLGQLFCDGKSTQIVDLLVDELKRVKAELHLQTTAGNISRIDDKFQLTLNGVPHQCDALVIATGGKSIPKMGASGFGYDVAKQFDLNLIEPRPALVPFTFNVQTLETMKGLAGVSLDVRAIYGAGSFDEAMLFTHRGLSGPAMLQISSYWREGDSIGVNLMPSEELRDTLVEFKRSSPNKTFENALSGIFPNRFASYLAQQLKLPGKIGDISDKELIETADYLHSWKLLPAGTEGYRTAEVTLGGIDTNELSSKTMEAKKVPGLYFIGEVVDVTGWLGGFNFQWAWSSAWVCGSHLSEA